MTRPTKRPTTKRTAKARGPNGGARSGAGRPRDRLPADVVERLGTPPSDSSKLDLWVKRALAELVVLQMTGEVSTALAASLRATLGEIRRNLSDEDEGGEDEDDGPKLEWTRDGATGPQPIRVDP